MRRRGSCMYYADAGLLAVGNLITIDDWILDRDRSHCSVCVQQFHAFKRRHHCRTCGEVICSRCSKHRKLRLVELNVDLTARICAICVTAATLAARDVSAAPLRPTLLETPSSPVFAVPVLPWDDANLATWRLEVARQADTLQPDQDDTLKLLVHLVATSLRCPIVFLGLLDPSGLHIQASLGLDPSTDSLVQFCAPVWRHNATLVLSETDDAMLRDQGLRYFAGTPIVVEGLVLGALVAMDMEPHGSTNLSQRNTLESVARIAAEVLEQRAKEANHHDATTDLSLDVPEKSECEEDAGDGEGTAPCTPMNEFQKALYASSPRVTRCSDSNQTIELPSSAQQMPAYEDAVESMLQLYRILHGCSWEPTSVVVADRRVQFHTFHERYQHGYIKATRELTSMPGSMSWATLVQLPQMHIYSNCLAQYVSHQPIDGHTTLHNVVFQPGISWTRAKQYPLLTHARDYPNGAAVYLGMQLRDDLVPEFCFGWMLGPSDDDGRAKVSVIVPQHREIHEANMIATWLDQLQDLAHAPREQRARSVDMSSSHEVVASRPARANTTESRPATEAFFWTLLEQTISTQRMLSERQSDLMHTMETNGSRLHQLTQAVERVEWRLDQPL
ncbi:hypothetical protein SPRG_10982 [Saprolegnia parasitica CBS 223.65]|uniref:FYVE-type domain-containing protein n=1 Tax=Saprolegnia parasitica (strain CBS 223.65) TaxID=695850 RepID=A0A067C7B8_SAPPC|nr:hypothetical protein SPRG_10982 [Saprolegnia parasitica CBS 223.65]KDO22667.1 hypothetical protein SPRG_10982 [Saprolegnia parasitica CBS 223.65]|eukprot:XP_012206584.1 hypothetical protein SPRG_10982 [Saprolegnia parasitica CBS 223.65]